MTAQNSGFALAVTRGADLLNVALQGDCKRQIRHLKCETFIRAGSFVWARESTSNGVAYRRLHHNECLFAGK